MARKKSEKTNVKDDVARKITDKMIAAMEEGLEGKWERPWVSAMTTAWLMGQKRPAQGFNWLILAVEESFGGKDGPWATYNQWQALGGQVRKGEKSTACLRPLILPDKKKIAEGDEDAKFIIWKSVLYFAASQQDGWVRPESDGPVGETSEQAEQWWTAFTKVADVRYGGDRAYYSPSYDYIQLPHGDTFTTVEGSFGTRFHEAIHWTGHKDRLNREDHKVWGDNTYAFEELVAELGASIMANYLGIADEGANSAKYLQSWLKGLRSEDGPELLWKAAGAASKAAKYLLDLVAEKPEVEEAKDAKEAKELVPA